MTSPVIAGNALPAFIGTPPGSTAPVREHCTRGNGGGFAAEVVCVLGSTVPGLACWSHVNPLIGALTL